MQTSLKINLKQAILIFLYVSIAFNLGSNLL